MTRLDKKRLDYKEPLHALYAAKKLIVTDRPTDRPTDIAISRAPMELKMWPFPTLGRSLIYYTIILGYDCLEWPGETDKLMMEIEDDINQQTMAKR